MARGIDVYSAYQNVTDWGAVRRAGYEFAYIKVSDGVGTRAVRGWGPQGRAAGVAMGGYHYAQFGDPIRQANLLVDRCIAEGLTGLAPALDLEHPFSANQTAVNFAVAFVRHVRARGFRPALYANNSMMSRLRGPVLAAVPDTWLWVARYASNNSTQPSLRPSGLWHVHQYSQAGRVPGITASSVDLNDGFIPFNYTGGPVAVAEAPRIIDPAMEDDENMILPAGKGQQVAIGVPRTAKYVQIDSSYGPLTVHQITFSGPRYSDNRGTADFRFFPAGDPGADDVANTVDAARPWLIALPEKDNAANRPWSMNIRYSTFNDDNSPSVMFTA